MKTSKKTGSATVAETPMHIYHGRCLVVLAYLALSLAFFLFISAWHSTHKPLNNIVNSFGDPK